LASAPVSLDPLSTALGDEELAALVYDTPFRVDATGQPRPHLAVSLDPPPPPSEGLAAGTRARLRIRTDVRFHDGTPVRAADVAASLQRALRDPGGWSLGPVKAARAIGDDLVELELTRPAPDLALLLSTPAASITPNGAAPTAARAIGSGPFAVEGAALGGDNPAVKLAANPSCFAGRPYLDTLSLRAFASRTEEGQSFEVGTLKAARHGGSAFATPGARRPAVLVDGPVMLTGFLAIGRLVPDEVAGPLRSAMASGIDRERLRRQVREPARAAVDAAPPALGGTDGRPTWDAAGAKAIIDQRFPNRLKLTLMLDRSRFDDRALGDRLLVELGRLGIDLTLEPVDAATYQQRLASQKYELALGTTAPPAPNGGLAELAVLAAVDPAQARAILQRSPAQPGAPELKTARVLPLYHRAARAHVVPELRGLALDGAGRLSWPDAHLHHPLK
jgi:peptide/nickel transport system substrate-binding protein